MAHINKRRSELKKQAYSYLFNIFIAIICSIIFISVAVIIDFNILYKSLASIIVLVIATILVIKNYRSFKITYAGVKGENQTYKELKKLPKNYTVYNNVILYNRGRKCEIDYIVCSTKGIYIIEVKNHRGNISGSIGDDSWLQCKYSKKGNEYTKEFNNPMKQLMRQVDIAHEYLKSKRINVWVQGIVYFSHEEAKLNIRNKPNNLFDNMAQLNRYLKNSSNKDRLSKEQLEKINKTLKNG